jgi:predicted nuclease of restriction endonuclease-like (RecB) superfamily
MGKKPSAIQIPPQPGVAAAEPLFERVSAILDRAQAAVARTINSEMVLAYWHIGREIVEAIQGGEGRAEYGQQVMEGLSASLVQRYGRGFSVTTLRYIRQFYQAFANRNPTIQLVAVKCSGEIHHLPSDEFKDPLQPIERLGLSPALGWTHYRTLARIEDPQERAFYEIEAEREGWSVGHLERQIHTCLFARLLKSQDKTGVLDLANRGQVLERPLDAIKDPYVLDFMALPEQPRILETDLETALISQLQAFLLELGKGFAFVARQKRIAFEDTNLFVDLVFYNWILKCFVLIDLKMGRLTHQDVGQMDGYVRVFDDQHTAKGDNPTIGLILCAERNEAVAKYSVLNDRRRIFAAKYLKVLPTEEELRLELERERQRYESATHSSRGDQGATNS